MRVVFVLIAGLIAGTAAVAAEPDSSASAAAAPTESAVT